jgi:hypothetical protein
MAALLEQDVRDDRKQKPRPSEGSMGGILKGVRVLDFGLMLTSDKQTVHRLNWLAEGRECRMI